MPASLPGALIAELRLDPRGTLFGWVLDPANLRRRFVVELLGDDVTLAIVKADMHTPELHRAGYGDGCYGFVITPDQRTQITHFELLIANSERIVASCTPASDTVTTPPDFSAGSVMWRGGLRLSGSIHDHRADVTTPPELHVYLGSRRLDGIQRLYPQDDDGRGGIHYQFDLMLPAELADSAVHRLRVLNDAGTELAGSPISLMVHRTGFRGLASMLGRPQKSDAGMGQEALGFLDQLIPASLPFEAYAAWSKAHQDSRAYPRVSPGHRIKVLIVGRLASEATLASLQDQRGEFSIRVAILDIDPADGFRFSLDDWDAVKRDLDRAGPGETIILRAGTTLKPDACLAVTEAFRNAAAEGGPAALCLADHELFDMMGASLPVFLPAFDYERLLSQGYGEGLMVAARLPDLAQTLSGPASTYDILFSCLEQRGEGKIAHVPRILASVPRLPPDSAANLLALATGTHLTRCGTPAHIALAQGSALPAIHVLRPRPPGEVAIIIPTRDRLDLLEPCIRTLRGLTTHPDYRIVIVDNGSQLPETHAYLDGLAAEGVTIIRDDGPFNYSRLNNLAVAGVASPFICLLNNDIEVIEPGWLEDMQACFTRADVGAVGAKLLWPNGMLQHGGVVMGLNMAAGHAYDRYLADEPGYADGILVARECSALTAACLLVRREDFLAVGGLDERAFPVAFNDVDLCLKLREAGKVLIWSPRARLLHRESASRSSDSESVSKRGRADKELAALRRKWSAAMDDPYYNPNLNLDAYSFTGLSLPPRSRKPRYTTLPAPLARPR